MLMLDTTYLQLLPPARHLALQALTSPIRASLHAWMRPQDALERRDAGEIEIAPPTWVTLHELSVHQTTREALETTESREPERFETRIAMEVDGPTAMWKGDSGWPEGDAESPGSRHRLRMHGESWSYERSE